ncbi:protoporphyrinogen oxidase HemJ [Rickettsia endosymbiont of Cardiosporidium cionae]|uniref:protoporphyrinogen oxidase HemJ n=1 Tax=Rickettsia endosymbiont of Cardiosporidium cionae TaxID=2777155 RepID=UPI0018942788|nr:protoporphyrinogen oxidase HemJ [Rickettsia endosymbiont of Cardiosporidium cionae]
MSSYYDWYKAAHIISVICWMSGMLYMPRLFVYHSKVKYNSESDVIFKTMERRLMNIIMNPSIVLTYIFGLTNSYIYGIEALGTWFHIKMVSVTVLTFFHFMEIKWKNDFLHNRNKHSERFYRIVNEIPSLFMLIAVIMVVVKPFE